LVLLAVVGSSLACGRSEPPAAGASESTSIGTLPAAPSSKAERDDELPAPSADDPAFTLGILEQRSPAAGVALLTDVRSARHRGFDRVVFEFAAETPPGFHAEYVDRPVRKCGSGEPTPVAGDAWLEVRFEPANAHTASGAPTIADRDQQLALGVVKELEQTCDFEAHVTWVIGVSRPNKYRVLTLKKPARIVLDVALNPSLAPH
jgi:hypothetical protein